MRTAFSLGVGRVGSGIMFATFEGDAAHLIAAAKLDPDGTVNVRRLVAHHLGTPPRLVRMRGEAELVLVEGRPLIYVRSGTTPSRARWLACHELAHWWLVKTRQEDAWQAELQANVLGAMLVAPGRAITRAVRLVGRDPIRIATILETTQSLALLRLGDTGHAPAALVELARVSPSEPVSLEHGDRGRRDTLLLQRHRQLDALPHRVFATHSTIITHARYG